jgi:hypothetical protein
LFPVDAILILALAGAPGAPQMPCACANSTAPACIALVGTYAGTPAVAFGQFTVVVRDPAATVDCAGGRVSKLTAADGSVRFTILGHSNGGGNASSLLGIGKIFANGTLIASPTVSTFDLDGQSGVGANDLSCWLTDFGSGQPYGRDDYDCSGGIGANDLSFWLTAFGSGAMAESCGASCP